MFTKAVANANICAFIAAAAAVVAYTSTHAHTHKHTHIRTKNARTHKQHTEAGENVYIYFATAAFTHILLIFIHSFSMRIALHIFRRINHLTPPAANTRRTEKPKINKKTKFKCSKFQQFEM